MTGKIDDGEGTVGALINDRETVDALNETLENANDVIEKQRRATTDAPPTDFVSLYVDSR